MAQTAETRSAGGRPKTYTPCQVRAVIGALVAEGSTIEQITAKMVKARLCADHGISQGIREDSLAALVAQIREENAEDERRRLLKALPESVTPVVEDMVASVRQELLLLVARQNDVCRTAAERECEDLRADKRNANWRIAELEAEIARKDEAFLQLERERDAARSELADLREEHRLARGEIERLGRETGALDRLLSELRDPRVRTEIREAFSEIVTPQATAP